MKKVLLLISGIVFLTAQAFAQFNQRPVSNPPKEEFRSIWIATVPGATDWPKGSTTEEKQQRLRQIIQAHVDAKMNAIVFQAVGRGDAMYQSQRLPWNFSLEGLGVDPGWDPLQFVIDEAKKHGLEVHAWYNVFNVGNTGSRAAYLATSEPEHIVKAHPDWVNDFGTSIWMNPGIPEARQWAVENVMEIVENYDIDAIHFDFARYPSQDGFPGDFDRQREQGFVGNSADWRRNNVNEFQRAAYNAIQEIKPWVKVGTSPVGHYRRSAYYAEDPCPTNYQQPFNNSTISGCSWPALIAYSAVYQDAGAWINEGVNDYIVPQLYWNIGPSPVYNANGILVYSNPHFEFLSRDWKRTGFNSGRHIYIGIGAYQTSTNNNVAAEIATQVDTIRANNHHGHMFFRFDQTIFAGAPDFRTLRSKIDYQHRAFVPSMDWKDMDVPPAVQIAREITIADDGNDITLTWEAPEFETASGDTKLSYAIYRVASDSDPDPLAAIEVPANLRALTGETSFTDRITEAGNYYYFVTAYSRNWVEGAPSNVVEHYTATSIDQGDQIASGFTLEQNYPNPFNPTTQIRFSLGQPVHATLTVYDVMGRVVATLVDQPMSAGTHSAVFNASNLSSGVYIYSLRAGEFTQTNKMLLVK